MSSFVRRDYEILGSMYKLLPHFYRGSLHALPDRVATFAGMSISDFNFSWFGYDQAFWATRYSRLLGKKSIVVLGGFDVCEEEDALLFRRLDSLRYILRNADKLLAVSQRVREKALSIEPSAEVDLVYHGFDAKKFLPGSNKERMVSTVAFIKEANLTRKGLETFVRCARILPDYRFMVVGEWLDGSINRLREMASSNLIFTGRVREHELIRILQSSSVYVQASTHEGFGCSLAEAMLCGCVPVVSRVGAIPEVVGDAGLYINPDRADGVASAIRAAFSKHEMGVAARERIVRLFPLETRRVRLLESLAQVLD